MFDKEEIDYYIQEVREHPENVWNTPDEALAHEVFAEISKDNPEARLYTLRAGCGLSNWITHNKDQRQELLQMLQNIEERKAEELEELRETIREIETDV